MPAHEFFFTFNFPACNFVVLLANTFVRLGKSYIRRKNRWKINLNKVCLFIDL